MRTTLGQLVRQGVLEFSDGYRTRKDELDHSGYRIVRAGDLHSGRAHFDGPDFVNPTMGNSIGRKFVQPGDVALTTKGTVGRAALVGRVPELAVYSPQICFFRVRDTSALDSRYLLCWFRDEEFWGQASYLMSATDMAPYLSLKDIGGLHITLPDLATQTAIADVLGAMDDKIAANDRVLRLGDDLLRSRFSQLMSKSCDWVPLSHYVGLRYGKSLPSAQRRSGEVSVVGSGGPSGAHDQALVEGPGVVVGRKGSIGTVWWCDGDFWPIDTAFYAEPRAGIGPRFVYALLTWMKLGEHNGDSAVPGLNRDVALGQPAPLVTDEESVAFEALAEPIMDMSQGLRAENVRLAATRDALLPELMSGRLTVGDG